MKEKLKSNEGATLIELLMTIVCCSVVTLAAVTLVFLGMGISTAAYDDAGERQTVRTVLTVLESAAEDGTIQSVRWYGDDWEVVGKDGDDYYTLFQFKNSQKAVTTGGGAVLLENVEDTTATLKDNLLTISLTVDGTEYTTSVYCRMAPSPSGDSTTSDELLDEYETPDLSTAEVDELVQLERQLFLVHLASQYGSTGTILGSGYSDYGKYYSQWYIGDTAFNNPEYGDWNADTAWCACYVSWALEQVSDYLDNTPKFAAVRAGWSDWEGAKYELEELDAEDEDAYTPEAGDLIFFHWYDGETLDHVGVVFYVDDDNDNNVYTIEGNSGGRVALHRYDLTDETDSSRIAGFAVLNWKTEVTENP